MSHHITRLRITSFCGIEALDVEIPPAGAVFAGKGGLGKTSALNAIRAALGARNVSPSAIREGADRAEILVDVDDVTVRRLITKSGNPNLTITTKAGDKKGKPQAFLNDLVGGAPLDPLEFFLARPEKQREMVLAALPVTVTMADVERWIPSHILDLIRGEFGSLIDSFDSVHGLVAVEDLHKIVYANRKSANATAEALGTRLAARREAFEKLPNFAPELAAEGRTVDLAALDNAVRELQARDVRVTAQAARFAETREKVATMRAEADAVASDLGDLAARKSALVMMNESNHAFLQRVSEAKLAFEAARARYEDLEREMHGRTTKELDETRSIDNAERMLQDVARRRAMADDLEATIAASTEKPVTSEELQAALDALRSGQRAVEASKRFDELLAEEDAIAALNEEAFAASELADELTVVVDRLRVDAPKELIAAQNGIPGLSITDDGISLDGKPLALICGKEKMRLAIELARRSNPKARILVVDGLEQIAPAEQAEFFKEATRDGYQLIASRVQDGELVVEHVIAETAEAAQ